MIVTGKETRRDVVFGVSVRFRSVFIFLLVITRRSFYRRRRLYILSGIRNKILKHYFLA